MKPAAAAWFYVALLAGMVMAIPASARDAAFLAPGLPGTSDDGGAVKVEPKSEIEIGDTAVNVARRTTLFFVNQTTMPVKVEKVAANADSNVVAEITTDDCSKQGVIAPASRCSVEVSVTPSAGGNWSVDVLLTHDGAGRIARAKISGKTSGAAASDDKRENGLALSGKQIPPVTFGDVDVGGKAVRSALMVNDSAEPISIYSIDVVEAGNGLTRLDQGCAVDMELKPGESCPVTLLWAPVEGGQVSTDLIIRHSGRLGFAVIPIRGSAKGPTLASGDKGDGKNGGKDDGKGGKLTGPTADMIDKAMEGKIPPVSASSLPTPSAPPPPSYAASDVISHLIGTVGNRAVFLLADGSTAVAGAGEEVKLGGQGVKVLSVSARSVQILADNKKKDFSLEAAPELTSRAQQEAAKQDKSSSNKSQNRPGNSVSLPVPASAASTASGSTPIPGM